MRLQDLKLTSYVTYATENSRDKSPLVLYTAREKREKSAPDLNIERIEILSEKRNSSLPTYAMKRNLLMKRNCCTKSYKISLLLYISDSKTRKVGTIPQN